MRLDFSGRQALVAGGSCELALDLAEALMASGIRPLLGYRSASGRRRIMDRLQSMPGDFDTLFIDLAQVHTLDQNTLAWSGQIDYLVDFAQDDLEGLVAAADNETVRRFFDTQISGRSALVQQVSRRMLGRKNGRLLFVSSSAAGSPNPGQGFYAAAKCASEALYRNIGLEMAHRGVTTVILRPGYIESGRGRRYLVDKDPSALERMPLGRPLTRAEVVQAIMFLLSDSARGFNASVLTMDGGLTAGKPFLK